MPKILRIKKKIKKEKTLDFRLQDQFFQLSFGLHNFFCLRLIVRGRNTEGREQGLGKGYYCYVKIYFANCLSNEAFWRIFSFPLSPKFLKPVFSSQLTGKANRVLSKRRVSRAVTWWTSMYPLQLVIGSNQFSYELQCWVGHSTTLLSPLKSRGSLRSCWNRTRFYSLWNCPSIFHFHFYFLPSFRTYSPPSSWIWCRWLSRLLHENIWRAVLIFLGRF